MGTATISVRLQLGRIFIRHNSSYLKHSLQCPRIMYISKKKTCIWCALTASWHQRSGGCVARVLCIRSSVPVSVRFPCVLSPSPMPARHYCVLSCVATLPCILTWRPPCSPYPSVLTLSILQPLLEAIKIIILLPLVSWREPCSSPAPTNVLWCLSSVVITGMFNSCINYIFSSY